MEDITEQFLNGTLEPYVSVIDTPETETMIKKTNEELIEILKKKLETETEDCDKIMRFYPSIDSKNNEDFLNQKFREINVETETELK